MTGHRGCCNVHRTFDNGCFNSPSVILGKDALMFVTHSILSSSASNSVSLGGGESSSSRSHPKSIGFCLLISQKLHSGPVHLWKRRFSVDQSLSRSIYCSQLARNLNVLSVLVSKPVRQINLLMGFWNLGDLGCDVFKFSHSRYILMMLCCLSCA